MARLSRGQIIPPVNQRDAGGGDLSIPDATRVVHLQFRRFAGCPICNLHLHTFARRHDEIAAAGVREVVVFHSTVDELAEHRAALPFTLIADPGKSLYRRFGVEASLRAGLDPRAWGAGLHGLLAHGIGLRSVRHGGPLGLPADFLIGKDGRLLAVHYGVHADDQWSVDTLLRLLRELDEVDP